LTKPWQDNCEGMLRMLAEDLQFVRGEMAKMSSKVKVLETQVRQLHHGHFRQMSRASSSSGHETVDEESSKEPTTWFQYKAGVQQMQQDGLDTAGTRASLSSLEVQVVSMQKAVVELEVRQQRSMQEAMEAAFQEIHALRKSLSSSMEELHDARVNMECHTASLQPVMNSKLDYHRAHDDAKTDENCANGEINVRTMPHPVVFQEDTSRSDSFVQLWCDEHTRSSAT